MVIDPIADMLVFKAEPDAPTEAYPEVEIHFASTVGNAEPRHSGEQEIDLSDGSFVGSGEAVLAEREIYLRYEFEDAHAEPLPTEETSAIYSESDAKGGGSIRDGAVIFTTDSVEAGDEPLDPDGVVDLSSGDERQEEGTLPDIPILTMPDEDDGNAEFVGMDSFIYTVVDDGSSVRSDKDGPHELISAYQYDGGASADGASNGGAAADVAGGMIWSIETDDFAGLSDQGEAPLGDVDMNVAMTEFGDSTSDWFLA